MSKQKREPYIEVPLIKVNANSIVCYSELNGYVKDIKRVPESCLDIFESDAKKNVVPDNNFTNGFLSAKASGRLRNSIKIFFWLSGCFVKEKNKISCNVKNKISFITLTLPSQQQHSDNFIKANFLNQFIQELRTISPGLNYVWRAEKQLNGNIHFHFLVNKYFHHQLIRLTWNRIIEKEKYITAYNNRFKNMSFEQYLKTYDLTKYTDIERIRKTYINQQSSGWNNPNSTDIISLKKVKHAYAYISKYCSKTELEKFDNLLEQDKITVSEYNEHKEKMKIQGRIWYASEKISNCKQESFHIEGSIFSELQKLSSDITIKVKEFIYSKIILCSAEKLFNLGFYKLFSLFYKSVCPEPLFIN